MTSAAAQFGHMVPENAVRVLGHATHEHDVPHLVHVVVGTAHLVVDGEPFVLHSRESLWLAPGVPHSARFDTGSIVMGPFLRPEDAPTVRAQPLGVVPALAELLGAALALAPSEPDQVEQIRVAIGAVLRDLRTPHFVLTTPTHPVAALVASEAQHSDEPLAVLAARHATSARHLQRLWRQETGLPFHRWRVRARLNTAVARLRAGDSVDRAARAAGYASPSGLRKALAREIGPDVLADLLRPAPAGRATGRQP